MASAHHQQAPAYAVPHSRNDQPQRLPSLRNMDFFQGSHGPGPVTQQEYAPPSSLHHTRQEPPPTWSRSASSSSVPTSQQHAPQPQTRHAEIQKSQHHYQNAHPAPFASPQQPPPPTQARHASSSGAHANTRADVMPQQPPPKRSQSNSNLSETPGRSPQVRQNIELTRCDADCN